MGECLIVRKGTSVDSDMIFLQSTDLMLNYSVHRNYVESEYTAEQIALIKIYLLANLDNGGVVIE